MEIKRYEPQDFDEICSWFTSRGLKAPSETMLAKIGAVVPYVACGFLYRTDADFTYIDFAVTNPNAGLKTKKIALQMITEQLIQWSKELGYTSVMANTNKHSIEKIAMRNGFKNVGKFTVFMRGV